MKKLVLFMVALGTLCMGMVLSASAEDNAADLSQLRRLQKLADEQLQKARGLREQQDKKQPALKLKFPSTGATSTASSNQTPKPPVMKLGQQRGAAPAMPGLPQRPVESTRDRVSRLAFQEILDQMFPLTPEQIVKLRKKYNQSELAKSNLGMAPPKPVATSQFVNLSPGANPPVVRLSKGFVTSVVFLDSSGAEWPIEAYDLGDPKTFNIQWDKVSNVFMIQALKAYKIGNIGVRLRGLNAPVMITLIPGQKAVDYRIDMRVQGYGPNAIIPKGDLLPPTVHKELLALLDGVPPLNSRPLEINDSAAEAWLRGNNLFLRTRHQVISPGWLATLRSADGMHVYRLTKTPLVLVTMHGRIKRLKIEGL